MMMEKTSTRVIVDLLRKLGSDRVDSSQVRGLHNALLDELQKVAVVDLGRRKIGDRGIAALGRALQDCPVPRLEKLSLEANEIGLEGMAAIGEAIGCGNLTSLRTLHLSWNEIGEQGCKKLADGFLGNRAPKPTAAIAVKNNFSFEIWNKKSKSRNLRNSGSLNGNSEYSQDFSDDVIGMRSFKTAPNLHTLWLSGNGIGDVGTKALAEAFQAGHCPSLKVLRLFKNDIKVDGAQALAKALQFGGLGHLEALNLGQNPIGADGTKALVSAFKSHKVTGLKEIGLSFIPSMTAEGCVSLARAIKDGHLPALEALYLHKNAVGNEAAMALWRALASGNARKLKILDLEGNHIRAAGIVELANVLRLGHLPNLEILDLVENSIGTEGGTLLGEALQDRDNTNLKWLALAGNAIGDPGCMAVAKALEQDHMAGLERLDLASNGITFKGIAVIAKAFEKGKVPGLIYVSFDDNALDHRSVAALVAGAFKSNTMPALQSLSLKRNRAGDTEKAAEAVIAAYAKNPHLKADILYDWPNDSYAARAKEITQERSNPAPVQPQQQEPDVPSLDTGCWDCAPMLVSWRRRPRKADSAAAARGGDGILTPKGSFRDPKTYTEDHSKSTFCDVPPLQRPPT